MKITQGSVLIYGANKKNREALLEQIIEEILGENPKLGHNFIQIQSEGSIGIELIRYLENQIKFKPLGKNMKVAVIKDSQNLTPAAQNALLKTLEEPPCSTVIILEADQKNSLPETLTSRCLPIFATDIIDYDSPKNQQEEILMINRRILSGDIGEKFALAQQFFPNASEFLEKEIYFWRDLSLAKFECEDLIIHKEIERDLKSLAQKLTPEEISYYLEEILKTRKLILQNINKRLALEVLFLNAPKKLE